jgi:hypothetical protein
MSAYDEQRLETWAKWNERVGNQSDAATNDLMGETPALITVAGVKPERVRWLWPGRIPLGKVTVLDGDPGLGKSTLTLNLAARVSTGSPMPDGAELDGPGAVVILSAEDGIADTIRPRLASAIADLERVHVLDAVHSYDDDGRPEDRPVTLPNDISVLEDAIRRTGAVLVVIDPLAAFLSERVDSYKDQHVRRAMMPLSRLAERTGVAIVIVRHLNKSGGANAIYRGGGSIGIIGSARSGLMVAPDPDDPSRRILAVSKVNLAEEPPAMAYRLVPDELHGCAALVWDGFTDHKANDLLDQPASDEERSAHDDAVDFLVSYLANGAQRSTDIKNAARKEGIAERTLHRARKDAHVTTRREGFGPGSTVWWQIDLAHTCQRNVIDAIHAIPQKAASMQSMRAGMASMDDDR